MNSLPEETQFEEWAILELMGHRKLAGRVVEQTIAGRGFLRIDLEDDNGAQQSQIYSPDAVYCITPTTEEIARVIAKRCRIKPIEVWEVQDLLPAAQTSDDDDDEEYDYHDGPPIKGDEVGEDPGAKDEEMAL